MEITLHTTSAVSCQEFSWAMWTLIMLWHGRFLLYENKHQRIVINDIQLPQGWDLGIHSMKFKDTWLLFSYRMVNYQYKFHLSVMYFNISSFVTPIFFSVFLLSHYVYHVWERVVKVKLRLYLLEHFILYVLEGNFGSNQNYNTLPWNFLSMGISWTYY